jgi:hypothetical protein
MTNTRQFKPDQEAAKAKADETLAQLGREVERLSTSDGWTQWLKFCHRFHSYSFSNLLLIAIQRPDASHVAGFRTWQSLGRKVKKGERAIRIIAPRMVGQEEDRRVFFTGVSVFDIAQTEGKDLPSFPFPQLGDGLEEGPNPIAQGLTLRLKAMLTAAGVAVSDVADLQGSWGRYHRDEQRIELLEHLGDLRRLEVLVHETAHHLLHGDGNGPAAQPKQVRELEAESTTYAVLAAFGLESQRQAQYLTTYGIAPEQIKAIGKRVQQAAHVILACLNPATPKN